LPVGRDDGNAGRQLLAELLGPLLELRQLAGRPLQHQLTNQARGSAQPFVHLMLIVTLKTILENQPEQADGTQ